MVHTIRIKDDTYERIKLWAEGFDTVDKAFNRVLDAAEKRNN